MSRIADHGARRDRDPRPPRRGHDIAFAQQGRGLGVEDQLQALAMRGVGVCDPDSLAADGIGDRAEQLHAGQF